MNQKPTKSTEEFPRQGVRWTDGGRVSEEPIQDKVPILRDQRQSVVAAVAQVIWEYELNG